MIFHTILLVVQVILAIIIIALVLLQNGKGADIGASFGSGSSNTMFGPAGADNILTTITMWCIALFFASSMALAVIAKHRAVELNKIELPTATQTAPSAALPVSRDDVPAIAPPKPQEPAPKK